MKLARLDARHVGDAIALDELSTTAKVAVEQASMERLITQRLDAFVRESIAVECWLLDDDGYVVDVGSTQDTATIQSSNPRTRRGDAAIGRRVSDVFPALCGLPLDAKSIIEFLHTGEDGYVDLHFSPHASPANLIVHDVTREAQNVRSAQALRNDEVLSSEIPAQPLSGARVQAKPRASSP